MQANLMRDVRQIIQNNIDLSLRQLKSRALIGPRKNCLIFQEQRNAAQ